MLAALYGKGEKPSSSAPQKSLDLGESKRILCSRGFATILWPKLGSEFDAQRTTPLFDVLMF